MKKVSKRSNRVIFSEFMLPMSTTETETEKLQLNNTGIMSPFVDQFQCGFQCFYRKKRAF